MRSVHIVDAVCTPIGRYNGDLASMRPDDLAALVIRELLASTANLDPSLVEDVYFGNAIGAGEENRHAGRMAALLAVLPASVPGVTMNRLSAAGMETVIQAPRAIAAGDAHIAVAGGVESMTGAPYVLPKSDEPFPAGHAELYSTTLGWRMVNPGMTRSGPSRWASRPNSSPTSTRSAASSRTSSPCTATERPPRPSPAILNPQGVPSRSATPWPRPSPTNSPVRAAGSASPPSASAWARTSSSSSNAEAATTTTSSSTGWDLKMAGGAAPAGNPAVLDGDLSLCHVLLAWPGLRGAPHGHGRQPPHPTGQAQASVPDRLIQGVRRPPRISRRRRSSV